MNGFLRTFPVFLSNEPSFESFCEVGWEPETFCGDLVLGFSFNCFEAALLAGTAFISGCSLLFTSGAGFASVVSVPLGSSLGASTASMETTGSSELAGCAAFVAGDGVELTGVTLCW